MKILHNPRCAKSRQTLTIIKELGKEIEVIEYLKNPPSRSELISIINMLGLSPLELIRKGEKIYKENYKSEELSYEQWIDVIIENPILIERPIVISDNKAIIGRPPELVLTLI